MSTLVSMAAAAVIGAAVGHLIHRNWRRAWVRGITVGSLTFFASWVVSCIGVCILSAYVKPGDQSDLGPILVWTGGVSLVLATVAACAAIVCRSSRDVGR